MVGTDDPPAAAAARSVEQPRAAMPADVMESPHPAVIATHSDQRGFEEIQGLEVAGVRNVVDVTDDLPGGAKDPFALEREEFRVYVSP
jgi:hypothetical protein